MILSMLIDDSKGMELGHNNEYMGSIEVRVYNNIIEYKKFDSFSNYLMNIC